MTRTVRSFCRICIAGCGTLVTVDDDDHIVSVRGDADHPLSHGYLCPKGRALGDLHDDPGRIRGAFIGRGAARVAVDHTTAAADAADALQRVIDTHGSGSIGFLMGSGGFIDPAGGVAMHKFRRKLGTDQNYTTATVDSIAKVVVTALMAGTTALVPHLDPAAELVVFVGSNPVVSHGQSTAFPDPIQALRAIEQRGGEVWVMDPRRTESAAHAHRHLVVRPGTDYALFACLVRDVLQRRSADIEAANLDVDALTEAVAAFGPERAASLCGIAAADIEQLADAIHERGKLAVITGTGTTMSPTGNLTEWLSWALMILTGSIDAPGGVWFNPGYLTRLDERPVLPAVPDHLPASPALASARNVSGEWPSSLIPAEIESGRLKALVVFGCNIVCAMPDTDRLEKALDQLDVLIVLDLFDNETGRHATHLFASPDQLERPDLTPLDLYVSARATQFTDAVVPEPRDRWPCWRTAAEIAKHMGIDLVGDPDDLTTEDILGRVARGVSIDELRAANGPVMEATAVHHWATSRLPNGGWDLAPAPLLVQLAHTDDPAPLQLAPRRQLRRENSRAYREGEAMEALVHPDDAHAAAVIDGQRITVTSPTGELDLTVRITENVRSGTVSIPHGWGDHNVNQLISAELLDELTGMPHMSGTAVGIRAAAFD